MNEAGIENSVWKTASAEECLSYLFSLNVSARYRFSRNLEGFKFPGRRSVTEKISEHSVKFLTEKASENKFLYKLNDEDHLRIFRFIQEPESASDILYIPDIFHDRDIFCFLSRLGFVSSCPTNLGTGNKFSIRLEVPYSKKIILSSLFHYFDVSFSGYNQAKESFSAEISAKNLNQRTLTEVLRFLAPFIQFITRSRQD